jgi:nucleoside-diphosphate-sugar epimerase
MVAITGATGLLGSYILQKFLQEGVAVVGIKRENSSIPKSINTSEVTWRIADVNDSLSLPAAFEGVDCIIHAAALVSFDPRDQKRLLETNIGGTANVVNACLALKIPRLIFVSSVAALGREKNQKNISEKNIWIDSAHNSDYAKSKYHAELEVYRGQEEGLSIAIVNPSIILAPDTELRSSAQLFNYVIQERRFFIDGQLNYVDVRDVCDLIWAVFIRKIEGEKFIASAGSVQLNYLLQEIAGRLQKRPPSIKVAKSLVMLAARMEEIRCLLTGAKAAISRQSVRSSQENFIYENIKSTSQLNIHYKTLQETLDWCCESLKSAYSINK